MLQELKKELQKLANPTKAKLYQKFFKTGKGEYGEGDVFLGITVPVQRQVVKKYQGMNFKELSFLLKSKVHEHRLVALLILVNQYKRGYLKTKVERKEIFDFYLDNIDYINNWDLVDLSAPNIVGSFLCNKDYEQYIPILFNLARSKNVWHRRSSVLACFAFIKENDFKEALKIAEILLNDNHDLIHKAVGWMLREVGKKNQNVEEEFLKKHYKQMPRTMLRYAIEKFSENKRKFYMKK